LLRGCIKPKARRVAFKNPSYDGRPFHSSILSYLTDRSLTGAT
jgi:hypothetical protein